MPREHEALGSSSQQRKGKERNRERNMRHASRGTREAGQDILNKI